MWILSKLLPYCELGRETHAALAGNVADCMSLVNSAQRLSGRIPCWGDRGVLCNFFFIKNSKGAYEKTGGEMGDGELTTARSCCLFVFQGLAWSLEARLGTTKV